MARVQFCRFRPGGSILRSPARISRRMWHVGARAKKMMFELAVCLHIHTKTKHFCTSAGASFFFFFFFFCFFFVFFFCFVLGTECVTNLSRSFTRLNSAHFGHSGT